jgi:hypothetical protein
MMYAGTLVRSPLAPKQNSRQKLEAEDGPNFFFLYNFAYTYKRIVTYTFKRCYEDISRPRYLVKSPFYPELLSRRFVALEMLRAV